MSDSELPPAEAAARAVHGTAKYILTNVCKIINTNYATTDRKSENDHYDRQPDKPPIPPRRTESPPFDKGRI